MPETINSPFKFNIKFIKLYSSNETKWIDIRPQVLEVTMYESLFAPFIKMEFLVYDQIGLFHNFPLNGEQIVVITWDGPKELADVKLDEDFKTKEEKSKAFMIEYVDNISVSDDARKVGYRIGLVSLEALGNARIKIARLFAEPTSAIVKNVYDNYIVKQMENLYPNLYNKSEIKVEQTLYSNSLYCTFLNPIRFINQQCRRYAIAQQPDHAAFLFFENKRGFNFVTLESLIEGNETYGFAKTQRERASTELNKYIYSADIVLGNPNSDIDKHRRAYRTITNIHYNTRFDTITKISGGLFENVYTKIDINGRDVINKGKHYNHAPNSIRTEDIDINTKEYIESMQVLEDGQITANRFPLPTVDNTTGIDKVSPNRTQVLPMNSNISPQLLERWLIGQETMNGLSQIDVTITVPGDSRLTVGELIYCELPKMDGFNLTTEEQYVSGLFLISEVKHILTAGGEHATVMRINKNSYREEINNTPIYAETQS